MKIAVIGSGAAALGVLDLFSTLAHRPDITLIDRAKHDASTEPPVNCWTRDSLRLLYDRMRVEHGNSFPPPKTNFGMAPRMRNVEGWGGVWDSGSYGGLTSIWGLSSIPFTTHDLQGWPFSRAELDPHYASIAKRIGIAGDRDALNGWLGEDFVNRPPVTVTPLITALTKRINSGRPGKAFRFVAGASRLAVETRAEEPNSCVLCGECMIGCPQRAMYSTVTHIEAWRRSGLISRVVFGRALAVDGQAHHVITEVENGRREAVGPFDRVYVCAGCIDTTEFAMRTLGQREGPRIVDNSVYTFPIVYTGPALSRSYDQVRYFGLTNVVVSAVPLTATGHPAQLQIYLMSDHLWRYFTPSALWSTIEPLGRAMRRRVLFVRVYLHGEYSQAYAIHVDGHRPARLSLARSGTPLRRIPDLWSELRRSLGGSGFFVPFRPTPGRTSSHYAASLPLGTGPVAMDASIAQGVYLCDSSIFPTAPAASPTFTIMANARRIADLSLRG
jgi:NAD-dependent dihydropyrimidine dehydrogenase PreA subunit